MEQYVPQIEVEWITGEFVNMVQTTGSVSWIADKFQKNSLFSSEYMINEKMKMYHYLDVLSADTREFMMIERC